jgi:hypothetical protein
MEDKSWEEFFNKLNALEKRVTALEEAGQSKENHEGHCGTT